MTMATGETDMDKKQRILYAQMWELGKTMRENMDVVAENPEDIAALETIRSTFQSLHPHLSNSLSERIIYLFSGAEIEQRICEAPVKRFWKNFL